MFYQQQGYDIYISWNDDRAQLEGFLSVDDIINRRFECYDKDAAYELEFCPYFLSTYAGINIEDMDIDLEDANRTIDLLYNPFSPADELRYREFFSEDISFYIPES